MATLLEIDATNSVVYVIGQASKTSGSVDYNAELSKRRMATAMIYLEHVLKVKCRAFKGGYLGYETFQLTPSDASLMDIHPSDYEDNPLTLNQAMHIFVFPCADLL